MLPQPIIKAAEPTKHNEAILLIFILFSLNFSFNFY